MAKKKVTAQENSTIALDTLKLNGQNPRKISASAFAKLCESVKRDPQFMELRPIITDENNTILGGNQRYRACLELGKKKVPACWVRVATGLTPEQRKRFVLVDNAPEGMAGEWDTDILQADWKLPELEELGFDSLVDALNGLEPDNPHEEWKGMPEFEQDDLMPWGSVKVNFANETDMKSFAKLVGQAITEKTKSIWHPEAEKAQFADKAYVDES
jgi:hypothetical protein